MPLVQGTSGLSEALADLEFKIEKINTEIKLKEGELKMKTGYTPLPLKSAPITVTIAKVNEKLIVDPWIEEEQIADARISMAINEDGNICAIQKGGNGYFTPQQIIEASKLAKDKATELRKKLDW